VTNARRRSASTSFSIADEQSVAPSHSESERDHWHGWAPKSDGAEPLDKQEPMVAIVHGILRRGRLLEFLRNNLHAASRASHHHGHRGSIDISSQLPFEHTSISLWRTYKLAQDFAYMPGGHAAAMKHSQKEKDPSRRRLPAGAAARLHRETWDRRRTSPEAARGQSRRGLN